MADRRNNIGQGPNEGLDNRTGQQNQQSEGRRKGILRTLAEQMCCKPSVHGDEVDQHPSSSGEVPGLEDSKKNKRNKKELEIKASLNSLVERVAREVKVPHIQNELSKTKEDLKKAQRDTQDLTDHLDQAQAKMESQEKTIKNLTDQLSQAQTKIESQEKTIKNLTDRLSKAQGTMTNLADNYLTALTTENRDPVYVPRHMMTRHRMVNHLVLQASGGEFTAGSLQKKQQDSTNSVAKEEEAFDAGMIASTSGVTKFQDQSGANSTTA